MHKKWSVYWQLVFGLLFSSLVGLILLVVCSAISHSDSFNYLLWNLVLAWVPLFIAVRLAIVLKHKLWSSWEALLLSLIWLIFLPNSFYMITDLIHLSLVPANYLVYYAVAFTSIIYTAVILGLISIYIVHRQLLKRFASQSALGLVIVIIAMCSMAIYVGRDLRWSSWDVLANPGGLLFDVSNRLIHPADYPTMVETAGVFFVLLGSMYILAWSSVKVVRDRQI